MTLRCDLFRMREECRNFLAGVGIGLVEMVRPEAGVRLREAALPERVRAMCAVSRSTSILAMMCSPVCQQIESTPYSRADPNSSIKY